MTDPHPEEPPFRRVKYVYMAMKIAVLVLAVWFTLRYVASMSFAP